ncbi:filamentous hemagglutinin N-terminal domain-containing protein [Aestuariibacter sp. AA17]|uniref:Filamentous hemagglutinin N-terminal domain-containing protein n=1 Tax=Fluctibacter corallii TaxID=2984329 RepID=A0ABT3A7X2_9ALTE|nr:filamentous hemagglutinin N-terminal domain-containing protein [Aestuariibacter sp. AA17]MCV2884698.1 filamentous hemagglutinin N-terminal domain-containing protein [Aestuariibacter sp. AA17]
MYHQNVLRHIARVLAIVLTLNPLVLSARSVDRVITELEENRAMDAAMRAELLAAQRFNTQNANSSQSQAALETVNQTRNQSEQALAALINQTFSTGITTDPNAAQSHTPVLKYAANGTPVIDIVEASQGGVSHNKLGTFNVDENGVIFNNSLDPIISVLGGWTDGNRRLAGGDASIILAEVTGNSASSLLGYTEILGTAAEFVLANPNGITCDGCGFINTPRAVFATGTPDVTNGVLNGFTVANGGINITGAGLNATNVSKFDILTRALSLNAALYANDVNIVTGKNYIDYASGKVAENTSSKAAAEFLFALDASALGAMYANNITLIGTEAGLGVRSEGIINATDSLQLTADGKIQLKETGAGEAIAIHSTSSDVSLSDTTFAQNVNIEAGGSIENSGTIGATQDVALRAGKDIIQQGYVHSGVGENGELLAQGALTVDAQGSLVNTGTLSNNNALTLAVSALENYSEGVIQSKSLDIQGDTLVNRGEILSPSLNINTKSIDQVAGHLAQTGTEGTLAINADSVTISGGMLSSQGGAAFNVSGDLTNNSQWLASGDTQVNADNLINTGVLQLEANTVFNGNALHNSGDMLVTDTGNATFSLKKGLNNSGLIQLAQDKATLATEQLTNAGGRIVHTGDGQLTLKANTLTNTDLGQIDSQGALSISATTVNNNAGTLIADSVAVTGDTVNNLAGTIGADTVSLTASTINNSAGVMEAQQLEVDASVLINQGGTLRSLGESEASLRMNVSNTLDNSLGGNIASAGEQLAINTQTLNNSEGQISANSLDLETSTMLNEAGVILADTTLTINTVELENTSGTLYSGQNLTISASQIDNDATGRISANTVTLTAATLNNVGEGEIVGENVWLSARQVVNHGRIVALSQADNAFVLNTQQLANHGWLETHSQNLDLSGILTTNKGGTIYHAGLGVLNFESLNTLNNNGGVVHSNGAIALNVGALSNDKGEVVAGQSLTLNATAISNQGGVLESGDTLSIEADTLSNVGGSIVNTGGETATLAISQELNNSDGSIVLNAESNRITTPNLVNGEGDIDVGSLANGGTASLVIDAQTVDNTDGNIALHKGDLSLTSEQSLINTAGQIYVGGDGELILSTQDTLVNTNGRLISKGNQVTIAAANVENAGGELITAGTLTIETDALNNVEGRLQGGNIQVDAQTITNDAGFILSTGNETAKLTATAIENGSGEIRFGGAGVLNADTLSSDENGVIQAEDTLELTARSIVNAGHIEATGTHQESLFITTDALTNTGVVTTQSDSLNLTGLTLDNRQGSIVLAGTGVLNIETLDALHNQNGVMLSNGDLTIRAAALNNDAGQMTALKRLSADVTTLTNHHGELIADSGFTLNADTLNNTNGAVLLTSQGTLSVTANEIVNGETGQIVSNDQLQLSAQTLNSNGVISGKDLYLSAASVKNQGEMSAEQVTIIAQQLDNTGTIAATGIESDSLVLTLPQLTNSGVIATWGADATLRNMHVDNRGGEFLHFGAGVLTIDVLDTLHNQAGRLATQGNLVLNADTLSNQSGWVDVAGNANITVNSLDNQLGDIALLANQYLRIRAANDVNNEGGNVAADHIDLQTVSLNNNSGSIEAYGSAANSLDIAVSGALLNRQGLLYSAGDTARLSAQSLDNAGGSVIHSGSGLLTLNTQTLSNTQTADAQGAIVTNGGLAITAQQVTNEGTLSAQNSLSINTVELTNQTSGVIAAANLNLQASQTHNAGDIQAGQATVISDVLTNSGTLLASGALSVTASTLNNNYGVLQSENGLQLSADNMSNQHGAVLALGEAPSVITVAQTLDNQQGQIASNSTATQVAAATLSNENGRIEGLHQLILTTTDTNNNQGIIGATHLLFDTQVLNNLAQGQIVAVDALALTAAQVTSNGTMAANQMVLDVASLNQQADAVIDANSLTLTGSTLDNAGAIQTVQSTVNINSINNSGTLLAQDALILTADTLNNQAGAISSGDTLTVTTQALMNQGNIEAQRIALQTSTLLNDGGTIAAFGEDGESLSLTASTSLENRQGVIYAAGERAVITTPLFTNSGSVSHSGAQQLVVTADTVNNLIDGSIASSAGLSLQAQSLNNNGLLSADELSWTATTTQNNGTMQANTLVGTSDALQNAGELSAETVTLTLSSLNNAGRIAAEGNQAESLRLNTHNIRNSGVIASNGQDLRFEQVELNNNGGKIVHLGLGVLTLEALSDLYNQSGVIVSDGTFALNATTIDNTSGQLVGGTFTLNSDTIHNANGAIAGQQGLTLQAATLDNQNGLVQSAGDIAALTVTHIDNRGGQLKHGGNGVFVINATDVNNTNSGSISGNERVQLTAQTLTSDGVISADQLDIHATTIANQGDIDARLVTLRSDTLDNTGQIRANSAALNHAQVNNTGVIMTTGEGTFDADTFQPSLHLNIDDLTNAGTIATHSHHFTLADYTSLKNQGGTIAHLGLGVLTIDALNEVQNQQGQIITEGSLALTTQTLSNQQGLIQAVGTTTLNAQQLTNRNGDIVLFGTDALTINVAQSVDNTRGLIGAEQLDITTAQLTNVEGEVLAKQATIQATELTNHLGSLTADHLQLQAQNVVNTSGTIAANNSMAIGVTEALNNQQGVIATSAENARITAGSINNEQGKINQLAENALTLTVNETLNNTQGEISAQGALGVSANTISSSGVIDGQSVTLSGHDILNSGHVQGGTLHISSQTLQQQGVIVSTDTEGESLIFDIASGMTNTGTIESRGDILRFTTALNNNGGKVIHAGTGVLSFTELSNQSGFVHGESEVYINQASDLNNVSGVIQSRSDITLSVATLDNNQGVIQNAGVLALQVNELDNTAGQIANSGSQSDIQVQGQLTNHGGEIAFANGVATLNANDLDNGSGTISSEGDLTLTAQRVDSQGGYLLSDGGLAINAETINNNNGAVIAAARNVLSATHLNNNGGLIESSDRMQLAANTTTNQGGVIVSGGEHFSLAMVDAFDNTQGGVIEVHSTDWHIDNQNIDNRGGVLNHAGVGVLRISTEADNTQGLNNQAGQIASLGSIALDLQGADQGVALNNTAGTISASNDIRITTPFAIDNSQGALIAEQAISLATNALTNTQGRVLAGTSLTANIDTELTNSSGVMYTDNGALAVTAQTFNNGDGRVLQRGEGDMRLQAENLSNHGEIAANTSMHLLAGTLNNAGAIEAATLVADVTDLFNSGTMIADMFTVNAQSINNQQGILVARGSTGETLSLRAAQQIDNQNGIIQSRGDTLTFETSVNNTNGEIVLLSEGLLTAKHINNQSGTFISQGNLVVRGDVQNQDGVIQAGQDLTLSDGAFVNDNGAIFSHGNVAISGTSLSNQGGSITGAGEQFAISLQGALNNDQGGTIAAQSDVLALQATEINNQLGRVVHQGNGELTLSGVSRVNNDGGTLATAGAIHLTLDALSNNAVDTQQGVISANALTLDITDIENRGGVLQANTLTLNAQQVDNASGLILAQSTQDQALTLNVSDRLLNTAGGTIESRQNQLDLTHINTLSNQGGVIRHHGLGVLRIDQLSGFDNRGGTLYSAGEIDLDTAQLNNANGAIVAQGQVDVAATGINNQQGQVSSNNNVTLSSTAAFNNTSGVVSGQVVTLAANGLNNTAGSVIANGTVDNALNVSDAGAIDNTNGTLSTGSQNWTVSLANISNDGGKLIHQGAGTLTVSQQGELLNTGAIVTGGTLNLDANGLDNRGHVQAGRDVTVTGAVNNSSTGVISADTVTLSANGQAVNNSGKIAAANALDVEAASITSSGLLYSGGNTRIAASGITNTGSISANHIDASGFGTLDNQGRIESATANYVGSQLINGYSGQLIASASGANTLNLQVGQLTNQGTLHNSGSSMNFFGNVTNNGRLVHAGTGVLQLGDSGSVNIQGGSIATAGTASLRGNISGTGTVFARQGMSIDTNGTFVNSNSQLYTQGNLTVNSAVNNNGGRLIADGSVSINTVGTVANNSGTIQGQNLNINAGSVENANGTITSTGSGSSSVVARSINNQNGTIQSSGYNLTVRNTSGSLNNNGGDILHSGSGTLVVNSAGSVLNDGGSVISNGRVDIDASGTIDNDRGDIKGTSFDIRTNGSLSNSSGSIIGDASGSSVLDVTSITNTSGTISASGSGLSISTGAVNNQNGDISYSGSGALTLSASSISNTGSSANIKSNGSITINAGSSLTNNGTISAAKTNKVTTGSLNNYSGATLSSRDLDLDLNVSGAATNAGTLSGKTKSDITTHSLSNSGKVQSDGTVMVDTQSLSAVGSITGRDVTVDTASGVSLASSNLISGTSSVKVLAGGAVSNSGNITSGGTIALSGTGLVNNGSIKASSDNHVNVSGSVTNNGALSGGNTLRVDANGINNGSAGSIAAGRTLDINSSVSNSNLLFAGSNMTIDGSVTNNNNILSLGNATIRGGTVNNNGGSIGASGNLSISGTINNNYRGSVTLVEGETTVDQRTTPAFTNRTYNREGIRVTAYNKEIRTSTVYSAVGNGTAGVIAAGNNLSLSGNIFNEYGTISAGGNLTLSGSGTNKSAQNRTETKIEKIGLYYEEKCLVGVNEGTQYFCYEPGERELKSQTTLDTVEETELTGGTLGSIVAGGSITGNLSGQFLSTNDSPTCVSGSANTSASGTAGSASRGNGVSSNNNGNVSVRQSYGSAQNTSGQSRNVNGSVGHIDANTDNSQHDPNNYNQQSETVHRSLGSFFEAARAIAQNVNSINNDAQAVANTQQQATRNQTATEQVADISEVARAQNQQVANGVALQDADLASQGVSPQQQNLSGLSLSGVQSASVGVDNAGQLVAANGPQAIEAANQGQYASDGVNVNVSRKEALSTAQTLDAAIDKTNNKTAFTAGANDYSRPPQALIDGSQDRRFAANDPRFTAQSNHQAANLSADTTRSGGSNNRSSRLTGTANTLSALSAPELEGNTAITVSRDPVTGSPSSLSQTPSAQQGAVDVNLATNANAPAHTYTEESREEYLTERGLLGSDFFLDTIGHNPDAIIRDMEIDEQGREDTYAQAAYTTLRTGSASHVPAAATQNVFLTDDQLRVLTEELNFNRTMILNGQEVLYAAIAQNDLLEDGVTISAGNGIDLRADGGIVLEAGMASDAGVILRSESGFDMSHTGFIDSDWLIGLELGGDFTNTFDFESENVWFDVSGDFINDALLTGGNIQVDAGGDIINNTLMQASGDLTLIAGNDIFNNAAVLDGVNVSLDAGNDVINRTEFEQYTYNFGGGGDHGQNNWSTTYVGTAAEIHSHNSLNIKAGNNIDLQGSELAAATDLSLQAGNDILLGAVEHKSGRETYFKGGHSIQHDITYDVVSLNAGGNLSVVAGNNLESEGASFIAGQNATLAAGNEMNLLAVNEMHLTSEKKTKKSTFKKKVTIKDTHHETVHGTEVRAGGDVFINALRTEDGLALQQTGDVTLVGATVESGGDMVVAGNNIDIIAQTYTDYESEFVSKKSFGGLKSKAKKDAEKTQKLAASTLVAGSQNQDANLSLYADDSVLIGASDVVASGDINITAFDNVLISAAEETSQTESMRKKGGLFSGGSLYSSKESMQGEVSTTANSALVDAGNNLNIHAGSATVVGSDVTAGGSLYANTDIGDIDVLSATEHRNVNSYEKSISVGFGDVLKSLTNPTELIQSDNGQIKFKLADATYDEVDFSSSETTSKGATLSAQQHLTLHSVGDINIEGATLLANGAESQNEGDGSLNLFAGGDINIRESENHYEETVKETHGSAELSVTVQHQAVEVAKAAKALDEAKDGLKQAQQDYRKYKKERDQLENTLAQLEAEYNSGTPGVDYNDVLELRQLLDDIHSDEAWYKAGIAAATANVASKTTGLLQQSAAAAQSTATWGFNAGVQLDVQGNKTETHTQESTSNASYLQGNNVNIVTGVTESGYGQTGTATIQGSHVDALGNLNIAAGELAILASQDTFATESEHKSMNFSVSQTVWGAAGGPTVNAGFNASQNQDKSTTYNNSTLTADNITISTSGDTRIQGGNVHADNDLSVDVGGDLYLISQQNRTSGSNKSFGVSGGFGFGGDGSNKGTTASNSFNTLGSTSGGVSSVNGGINAGSGRYQTRETVLSSLTSGNTATITVAGNTDIQGALIATQDSEGNDLGNLDFTTRTLTYTDLSNTRYSANKSVGISTSIGLSDTANPNDPNQSSTEATLNTSTLTYSNTSSYEKSKTLATIGAGSLTVTDEANSDNLASLNRDIDAINKELFSVDRQQGNIDLTVDHRLLSEDGRRQIAEDAKRTELLTNSIADVITKDSVELQDTAQHIGDVQRDLDVQKQMAQEGYGESAKILNDPNATPEQKQYALEQYAQAYSDVYDISIEEARVIASSQYKGAHFSDNGDTSHIYVSDTEQENGLDYAETIGHEITHAQIEQGGTRDRGTDELNEEYAHIRGEYSAENYGFSFSNNDLGTLNTGNSNQHSGNAVSETLAENTRQFHQEDMTEGDFYLSQKQRAAYNNALANCSTAACRISTEAKYIYISSEQNVALSAGLAEGAGKEVVEGVLELVELVQSPAQLVAGLKAIVEDPTLIAEGMKAEVEEVEKLLASFDVNFEEAGWDGANAAGEDLGRVTAKVVALVGGAAGAAKVGGKIVSKVAAKLDVSETIQKPVVVSNDRHNGATDNVNSASLNQQLAAEQITKGHAWDKHKGEFPEFTDAQQFQQHVENILNYPSEVRYFADGRTVYLDTQSKTVVFRDPNSADGGTAFRPENWKEYVSQKITTNTVPTENTPQAHLPVKGLGDKGTKGGVDPEPTAVVPITDPARLLPNPAKSPVFNEIDPNFRSPESAENSITSYLAPKGIIVNMAIDDSYQIDPLTGGVRNPGSFLTRDDIKEVEYVRQILAVKPEFKKNITHVQKFEIKEGTRVQESVVGPQVDGEGLIYIGGGNQIQIIRQKKQENSDVLIPIGQPKPIVNKGN